MRRTRLLLLIPAVVLIVFSWLQVRNARSDLVIRNLASEGIPMLYIAPETGSPVPGVVIAHGFAGSKQLMLGYSYTLARAGYATIALDFNGHGANPAVLENDSLQANLAAATEVLVAQPEVDAGRLAVLGHSMGSGAAMTAGIAETDRYAAVVAISPTGAAVTPDTPRNLMLQAGSLEGGFVRNAEKLLADAGGPNSDMSGGLGRGLVIVPNAEHITILFRGESHRAALDWLGQTFGTARTTSYVDRRIVWYGMHLLGWLLALLAVAPWVRSGLPSDNENPAGRRWLGLAAGALVAVALLAVAGRLLPLHSLLGIRVGGFVALWLFVAGLVWLAFNRPVRPPALMGILLGLLLFVFLSIAVGVMAQGVWVQWWLNGSRLLRWLVLFVLCLPWFLATGYAQWGASAAIRALWWLGTSVTVLAGMLVLLNLVPSVGFLMLVIPVFPIILAVLAVAASAFDRPWPFGIGSALFFGWVLAAVFPLA